MTHQSVRITSKIKSIKMFMFLSLTFLFYDYRATNHILLSKDLSQTIQLKISVSEVFVRQRKTKRTYYEFCLEHRVNLYRGLSQISTECTLIKNECTGCTITSDGGQCDQCST